MANPYLLESEMESGGPEQEDGPDERPQPTGPWSVAIFLADRAYGGPEEGGWWYDCGEVAEEPGLMRRMRMFGTREEADAYAATLEDLVLSLNVGRPPKSSVASDGVYEIVVAEGVPAAYPAKRPHYE